MSTPQLLAYHGDPAIKRKYLARVRAHAAADGKGCAISCTLHSEHHAAYETELGIPEMLASIFEPLHNEAKQFPEQFLNAIRVGADLSRVGWQFLRWLLTEELAGRDHPLVRDAVRACADVLVPLTKGQPADVSAALSAKSAAVSAASSAVSVESAAMSAAVSAAVSVAVSATLSVESAAESAVSAESAAVSAKRAVVNAGRAALSAAVRAALGAAVSVERAALSAALSAERDALQRMRDKLLELLAAAPVRKGAA